MLIGSIVSPVVVWLAVELQHINSWLNIVIHTNDSEHLILAYAGVGLETQMTADGRETR
jgi:hypothetical protein